MTEDVLKAVIRSLRRRDRRMRRKSEIVLAQGRMPGLRRAL